MGLSFKSSIFAVSLGGIALLAACSGDPLLDHPDLYEEAGDDSVLEEGEVVLGTTWEALSYPTCRYAWSDPDGDGWGWEFNRSCVVYRPGTGGSVPGGSAGAGGSSGGSGSAGAGGSSSSTPAPAPAPAPPPANCKNPEGTHSVMAALAVAAANELGRWQPVQDFAIGRVGSSEALVLSATGKARCGACTNIQALLDLQKDEAAGKVVLPGNVTVVPVALRSRMVAKYRDQQGCERQPSNGGTTNCPAEQHQLIFQRSEKGGCDTNYFFVAKKPDGSALQYPKQLKNKLLFVDRENPYVQFQSIGEVVSIDPTYGLNDAGSTSTGACTASCVKIGGADVSNQCCSCAGKTKAFKRATWNPATYLCL